MVEVNIKESELEHLLSQPRSTRQALFHQACEDWVQLIFPSDIIQEYPRQVRLAAETEMSELKSLLQL